jgi:CheY-like chemotaxis protein
MDDSAARSSEPDEAIPTILVVEDEPVIRELMAMLLEDEGFTVRQAVDGLAALEVIEQHRVDLVLSDVMMPRLDGASLVHRLRSRGELIPIVLMSAVYAEVDLPGVRFLRKPVDIELLLTVMAAALQESGRSDHGGAVDGRTRPGPFVG